MYTALQEIKLDTVDFEWIQKTTKVSHLKRAIRLIELDGDYYKQLKDACHARLAQIDPSLKRVEVNNNISLQTKHQLEKELAEWENNIQRKHHNKIGFQKDLEDTQSYFSKDQKPKQLQKEAERERNKGNEAIRSKDFDQAIEYYSKSLSYDPSMHQSYCNRALAHLKKKGIVKAYKDYQKCINDCDSALRLNNTYTKALHRKGKAYMGLKNRVEAYRTFQQVLKIQPDNGQINGEIQELWQELSEQQRAELQGKSLIKPSQFKKITIQQESDDDEQN